MDRRGFLRTVAGGSAAIALAGLLPAGCTADYPQAAADGIELAALTEKEYAVARAAAEALLDGVPVEPAAVAAAIDRELAAVGDPIMTDLKTVFGLIEHFTFLSFRRRTFTELTPEQRLRYLHGWARSRIALRRAAWQALRAFVQYFAWIRPETRSLTGFRGPIREVQPVELVRTVDFGTVE